MVDKSERQGLGGRGADEKKPLKREKKLRQRCHRGKVRERKQANASRVGRGAHEKKPLKREKKLRQRLR